MERYNRWYHSIQCKLLTYFMLLFILVIVSELMFCIKFMKDIHELTKTSEVHTMNQINTDMSRIFSNAVEQATIIGRDVEIQATLRTPLPENEMDMYKQIVNYNYILYDRNRLLKDINGIYVIGENGAVYRSSRYGLQDKDFRKEDWYQEVVENRNAKWLPPHPGSDVAFNLDIPTISVVVPVEDRASSRVLGVVVVDMLVESFYQMENSNLLYKGFTYMLDHDNKVIYDSRVDLISESVSYEKIFSAQDIMEIEKDSSVKIDGATYVATMKTLSESGWKILGLISYKEMYSQVEYLRISMVFTMTIFVLLAVFLAVAGSARIAKPLWEIRMKMKYVEEGDFTVYIENPRADEIGQLERSFNHMVKKINELMEHEQENQEKLRKAELKALQSQINPHFLYNTLDSINWMVRMNRVEKVEEMIESLTNFLRIGLSRGYTFISIKQELKHVENYVAIQKIRYSGLLSYEEGIAEELKDYYVVKMILQPIVENAIYHGIKEKGRAGLIRITAKETENTIIICVSDDGQGMSEERLNQVESMMEQGIDMNPNAYGIINVQRRIQMNFGKEYGLHFESKYGTGTQVYVTLPKKGADDFA